MDRSKLLRLVLIPVLLGLAATMVVKAASPQATATPAAAVVETANVVVVGQAVPIPARTKLTAAMLTLKEVPKEALTGHEWSSVEELVGKITTVELSPGEYVTRMRVVEEGKGDLPYRIPKGTRAFAVRIDEFAGVAGFVQPGDRVDILLVLPEKELKPSGSGVRPATGRLLYESVLVLEKGPAVPSGNADQSKLSSYTLALTPEAAVEVALASEIGYVKLVLRPAVEEPFKGTVIQSEDQYLVPAR